MRSSAIRPASLIVTLLLLAMASHAGAAAVPVEVKRTDAGWQLLRDGEPYTIKGAGGDQYLHLLAASGANSIRTWGAGPKTKALLDEAYRYGLTVTVGIWLGHERHGFDYNDLDQVAKQLDHVREVVTMYKDHPAVLAWGVGNEMEGYEAGDNAAIWSHVEACAALIKRLDPHHPTMTVIAEVGGKKVEAIHRLCPSIDIVGINSYAGAKSLPTRYPKAGGTKPYVVAEFGPPGAWEVEKTSYGAPGELTSTQKGPVYRAVYEALDADRGMCLGSYAFLWGAKVEATTTWFGMFLPDGSKLAAVDAMAEAWSGKPPNDRCPVIRSFAIASTYEQKPGAQVSIELAADDPEAEALTYEWSLMRDAHTYLTGGDKVDAPPAFPEQIVSSGPEGATLTLPEDGGIYRVYVIVKDPAGNAAVANLPLYAGPQAGDEDRPVVGIAPGTKLDLPAAVYEEGGHKMPWIPAGYMGNLDAIKVDLGHVDDPKNGVSCIRVSYLAGDEWGGVVWQDPIGDWGDRAGGYDLTGASALEFWARGASGGEVVNFGFGLLGSDKKFADSGKAERKAVRLTDDWRRYRIEIGSDVDLRRIKTGFFWSLEGQGRPVTFFLDDIRYVKGEDE